MAGKVSQRERHAAETRERILREANALFVRRGFTATTVDEIAERAKVSQRTFFRYFATKEALLFHDFEERLATIRERIEHRPADEQPADALVAVLCSVVDDIARTAEQRALLVRLVSERPGLLAYQQSVMYEVAEPLVAEALADKAGLPHDDLGLRAMVAAVSGCFSLALRSWITGDAHDPFQPVFRETLVAGAARFPRFD